jgi:acyl-CoA reductase-like NAD-dependent aldehyde dehydrogenase
MASVHTKGWQFQRREHSTLITERAAILRAIAQGIRERADDFARLTSTDVGTPIRLARDMASVSAFIFENMADKVPRRWLQHSPPDAPWS